MKSVILLDLDNCISDDAWRRCLITFSCDDLHTRYHAYHSNCHLDDLRNTDLVRDHAHKIVIVTSRHEEYRALTLRWLKRHKILVEELLMRENGDHRPSVEVKRDLVRYQGCFDPHEVHCCYDDREDIVTMYHSLDFRAEVRAITPHRRMEVER